MDKNNTKVAIASRYDRKASSYDRKISFSGKFGLNNLRKELLQHAHGDVLEIAAGTGKNLEYYPQNVSITATDLSSATLRIAEQRANTLGVKFQSEVMDAEKLQFPDASFDTVVSTLSLCTIPNPVAAIREMKRVCKPDGTLLFLEHGKSTVGMIGFFQDLYVNVTAGRTHCYGNRKPLEYIYKAGLKPKRSRLYLFGIFNLIVV